MRRRARRARARWPDRPRRRRAARRRTRARPRACRCPRARGRGRRGSARRPAAAPAPSTARAWGWCSVPGSRHRHSVYSTGVRGRLITIEGLDGAGKTTLARGLPMRWPRAAPTRGCCASPAGSSCPSASATLVKDPALRGRPARRGAALRRRARAARRGARSRPLLDAGALGAARPLRRLVAGLPGRRPRAGRRGGARDQRLRHRRPRAGPHAAAAHRPGARAARARPAAARRPTGSSARTTRSSPRSRAPTTSSPPRSPSASACSTPSGRRGTCSRPTHGGARGPAALVGRARFDGAHWQPACDGACDVAAAGNEAPRAYPARGPRRRHRPGGPGHAAISSTTWRWTRRGRGPAATRCSRRDRARARRGPSSSTGCGSAAECGANRVGAANMPLKGAGSAASDDARRTTLREGQKTARTSAASPSGRAGKFSCPPQSDPSQPRRGAPEVERNIVDTAPQTPLIESLRAGQALTVRRRFTSPGVHPFDTVEWELRDARIGHGDRVAFEQKDVEFPKTLVAERDQHRRPEVLPRPARLARARALGQADDRPRRRHDRRLGPRARLLRDAPRTATPSRPS